MVKFKEGDLIKWVGGNRSCFLGVPGGGQGVFLSTGDICVVLCRFPNGIDRAFLLSPQGQVFQASIHYINPWEIVK